MPSRKTTKAAEAAAARMPSIPKELIDQFVTGLMSAEAVQEISSAFKKALIERALGAELSHHLGYPPGAGRWCRTTWRAECARLVIGRREVFRQDTLEAWEEYRTTGHHVTAAEADAWLAELEQGNDLEPPACIV